MTFLCHSKCKHEHFSCRKALGSCSDASSVTSAWQVLPWCYTTLCWWNTKQHALLRWGGQYIVICVYKYDILRGRCDAAVRKPFSSRIRLVVLCFLNNLLMCIVETYLYFRNLVPSIYSDSKVLDFYIFHVLHLSHVQILYMFISVLCSWLCSNCRPYANWFFFFPAILSLISNSKYVTHVR